MKNISSALADLSMIWHLAAEVFPHFTPSGPDWDSAYLEWLPKVMAAHPGRELHLLLAEFLNLLNDGHTDYAFPPALIAETGFLPLTLDWVGDAVCVTQTIPALSALRYARVEALNHRPIAELLAQVRRYGYHIGDWISPYAMRRILPFFLKREDNVLQTDIGTFSFSLLPAAPSDLSAATCTTGAPYRSIPTPCLEARCYADGLLYIRVDDFLHPAAPSVRAALEACPQTRGLLLDLRENIGGMTCHAADLAELLISGCFGACQKWTRTLRGVECASASQIRNWSPETAARYLAEGLTTQEELDTCQRYAHRCHHDYYRDSYGSTAQRAIYDGACVVLTSRHTFSAAEDFLAMMRSNQRARLIGAPSGGSSGTPLLQQLRCGGRIRVCSVGYRLLDGTAFIGRGITPELLCQPTPEELRQGTDRVLSTGLSLLRDGVI